MLERLWKLAVDARQVLRQGRIVHQLAEAALPGVDLVGDRRQILQRRLELPGALGVVQELPSVPLPCASPSVTSRAAAVNCWSSA